jgi:sialic acid synthase SpsE
MIDNIKTAEESMGVKKEYSKSENENKKAMRSVVARREIKSGETLTTDNITTKRPMLEDSIPASEYYKMLGRKAATDIGEDSLLKRGMLHEK